MPAKIMYAKAGKWYLPTKGKFIDVCCKCGLEHKIELLAVPNPKRIKGGKMVVSCAIRFMRVKN